jgi:hypothetical protein
LYSDKNEDLNCKASYPPPSAKGSDKIKILGHTLRDVIYGERGPSVPTEVEISVENISNFRIATVIFEAVFFDAKGNSVFYTKHRETDLKPGACRAVAITSDIIESELVKSYSIKITKTITADIERFQFRRQEIKTKETGEEEIIGTIKNLGTEIGSTAVVAAFYDYSDRNIGTKVIIVSDIEPDDVKKFRIVFKPQEGDVVRNADLQIAQLDEYLSY